MNATTLLPTPLPAAPMPLGARLRQTVRHLRRRLGTATARAPVTGLVLSLGTDQMHSVRHPQGLEVRCLEGRLWLTFEHCLADAFLDAGDSLRCGTHQRLLIQALEPARCLIA